MGHKVYVSFKTEDAEFKNAIQAWPHLDYIDKSLNQRIESDDPDYVLRRIREDYLRDSTVTIFLIGRFSNEYLGAVEQYYIKKELQASLYNGSGNTKNGLLGVVLPSMTSSVFGGEEFCYTCGSTHALVRINNSTVIKEYSYNYYIPKDGCSWSEDDRYCVLVSWDAFRTSPNPWIDAAFSKRAELISAKTKVRPS